MPAQARDKNAGNPAGSFLAALPDDRFEARLAAPRADADPAEPGAAITVNVEYFVFAADQVDFEGRVIMWSPQSWKASAAARLALSERRGGDGTRRALSGR